MCPSGEIFGSDPLANRWAPEPSSAATQIDGWIGFLS